MSATLNGNCDGRDGIGKVLLGLTRPPNARLTTAGDYVPPKPYRRNYQPAAGSGAWLGKARADTGPDPVADQVAPASGYDLLGMAKEDRLAAAQRGRSAGRRSLASARLVKVLEVTA